MPGVLTEQLALRYLRELSPAIGAAAILSAEGFALAELGDPGERATLTVEGHGMRLRALLAADGLPGLARLDAAAALAAVRPDC